MQSEKKMMSRMKIITLQLYQPLPRVSLLPSWLPPAAKKWIGFSAALTRLLATSMRPNKWMKTADRGIEVDKCMSPLCVRVYSLHPIIAADLEGAWRDSHYPCPGRKTGSEQPVHSHRYHHQKLSKVLTHDRTLSNRECYVGLKCRSKTQGVIKAGQTVLVL